MLNAAGSVSDDPRARQALSGMAAAQVALATALLDKLSPGGLIVYVTCHWAHLLGVAGSFPEAYAPLATSKHETEQALRALMRSHEGVRLIIVCAGLVTGTTVGNATMTRYSDFADEQRAIGNVVTAQEVGQRVADVIFDSALPSGHVEIVGAPLDAIT